MNCLLIFDVDGTLIDSEKSIVRCINESSRKFGFELEDISRHIGVDKLTQVLKDNGIKEEEVKKIMKNYRECYLNTFERDTRPAENSLAVLMKLQANNELGILTLKDTDLTVEITRRFFKGVEFKYVVGGDRPILDKKEGLRLIVEESGVDPHKMFYIGDRAGDVKSANQAGVNAVWVSFGLGIRSELNFDYNFQIANKFEDLLEIFS